MVSKTLILGALAGGQMHGYEIRKQIIGKLGSRGTINFGSIYYGLKKYVSSGWVDHIRDEPGKGSPERSIYRITASGRRELKKQLEANLGDTDEPLGPLEAALTFMDRVDRGRAEEILTSRYRKLQAGYDQALAVEPPPGEAPGARGLREYRLYRLGAEMRWLKNLLPRLEEA
ncbi:MAG: PadR family transcriptional regulator [Gemmatimonadota bacterium]|nr:PadR family transcriptional regulator [Gemmatimonadota bacterium]